MGKYIRLSALSLVASALLIGCGSDSDTAVNTVTETGYFIDAPVEGLTYKTTSGLTGTTDSQGRFQYLKGEKVHFSLGKLNFGEAEPTAEGLISPRELAQNEELVTLMLRTLQALDIDNNPSNGITIPESVITALENMGTDIEMSNFTQDSEILDITTDLSELLDEDYDGEIDINDAEANAHFEQSLNSWDGGIRPDNETTQGSHGDGTAFDLSEYPESNLTQEVIDSLAYMGNEERLAHDIYTVLYNYHNDLGTQINQLANIPKSEQKHVEIVQDVIQRYDINTDNLTDVVNPVADKDVTFGDMPTGQYDIQAIQDLYDALYTKGIESKQAALEVGCMVEVVDVNDLDTYILQAEASNATDIVATFNVLRDGSYNHYWAFDKGLKNMGVTEGCSVLGTEWAKTTEEYPTNNNSH
jgi:hypothetical protein